MITEDYCSFEVAKLFKEKGFDECCRAFITPNVSFALEEDRVFNHLLSDNEYAVPTLQMAMKWLREVHKECIVVQPVVTDDDGSAGCLWSFSISKSLELQYKSEYVYELYAAACEAAIKYCLTNLI